MEELYTKKDLLTALKRANDNNPTKRIGYTYMTLLKYEKNGIISKPQKMIKVNGKMWRFYTKTELNENVQRIIDYKN